MGFSNLEILQQCENMLPFFVVALFATAAAKQQQSHCRPAIFFTHPPLPEV
jgi:hypothetical protein